MTDTAVDVCINDHPWNESNTHTRPNGTRMCRQCARDRYALNPRKRSAKAVGPPVEDTMLDDWRENAACAGFGRLMDDPLREDEALAVCVACPVMFACHSWVMALAETDDPGGVCGRMTEKGRTDLRWENSEARQKLSEAGRKRQQDVQRQKAEAS